jgi:hypothetical protein
MGQGQHPPILPPPTLATAQEPQDMLNPLTQHPEPDPGRAQQRTKASWAIRGRQRQERRPGRRPRRLPHRWPRAGRPARHWPWISHTPPPSTDSPNWRTPADRRIPRPLSSSSTPGAVEPGATRGDTRAKVLPSLSARRGRQKEDRLRPALRSPQLRDGCLLKAWVASVNLIAPAVLDY